MWDLVRNLEDMFSQGMAYLVLGRILLSDISISFMEIYSHFS